jgi:hypothetical protein
MLLLPTRAAAQRWTTCQTPRPRCTGTQPLSLRTLLFTHAQAKLAQVLPLLGSPPSPNRSTEEL